MLLYSVLPGGFPLDVMAHVKSHVGMLSEVSQAWFTLH